MGEERAGPVYLFPVKADVSVKDLDLARPSAVVIGFYGSIYITDTGNDRIVKLDRELRPVKRTSGWGSARDMMDEPRDLASGDGLNFFAADYRNGRIVRFDNSLNFLWDFRLSRLDERFEYPVSLATSSWGEVFVLEETSGEIVSLDQSGGSSGVMGGFRPGEWNLSGGERLAMSEEGVLYAAGGSRKGISLFDRYGNFFKKVLPDAAVTSVDWGEGFLWAGAEGGVICLKEEDPVIIEFIGCKAPTKIVDLSCRSGRLAVLAGEVPALLVFRLSTSPAGVKWEVWGK